MNKEEKNGFRLNLFDLSLIVLLVLSMICVFQRHNLQNLFSVGYTSADYAIQFESETLPAQTAVMLRSGQTVFLPGTQDNQKKETVGALFVSNRQNSETAAPDGGRGKIVSGSVNVKGVFRDENFLLNGQTPLAVNEKITLCTESVTFVIRIIEIKEVG